MMSEPRLRRGSRNCDAAGFRTTFECHPVDHHESGAGVQSQCDPVVQCTHAGGRVAATAAPQEAALPNPSVAREDRTGRLLVTGANSIPGIVVMLERLRQMLDECVYLRRYGDRLSINRHNRRRPDALPIRKDGYKLARAQLIFDVTGT
jgi:hypothetical protein